MWIMGRGGSQTHHIWEGALFTHPIWSKNQPEGKKEDVDKLWIRVRITTGIKKDTNPTKFPVDN